METYESVREEKKRMILEDSDNESQSVEEEEFDIEKFEMESVTTSNGELLDPLKKRRGRRPKQREEEVETAVVEMKKRGRKPKNKEEEEEDVVTTGIEEMLGDDKAPKRRGRKPKEKTYSVTQGVTVDSSNVVEKAETIILHLPIKKEVIEQVEPSPYLKKNINYSMISSTYAVSENVDMSSVKYVPKKDDGVVVEKKKVEDETVNAYVEFGEVKNDYDLNFSFVEKIKKVEEEVEEEKMEIIERVDMTGVGGSGGLMDDDFRTNKIIKKNLKNIMYEFVNSNSANTWPESTNTCCWWCCHQFTGMPCSLPELYRKDKFYVSGVFCSFNCAAAYNFRENDGEDKWMRYSLLNLMYKKMYGNKFVKIGLAPPRHVLKMFGGYMCIEELRETSLRMDKTFNVIKPPLVAIIPKIEECILNRGIKTGNTNEHILNKTQNSLKLKRTKPLMNPNSTLQSFMNIKIV